MKHSIKMDTTQDVGVVDQASILLRCVKDEELQQWLFALILFQDSSGKDMKELLQAKNKEHGIK